MPGKDTNIGAKRARQAREALGLDDHSPVACVLALLEERAGLPVIVGRLGDDVAGALWRNGVGALVWVNGTHSVERQRFTLAHELGHVRCNHDHTPVDTYETLSGKSHDPREVQANAFAAELLAPKAGVSALVDGEPTLEDAVRIAGHFGISPIAAVYRLRTLQLVSDRRGDQLEAEIAEGLHQYIDRPEPIHDGLADLEDYPRLPDSLAGSELAAVLHGEPTGNKRLAAAVASLAR